MISDIASYRLLELQHELVHQCRIAEYDAGTEVLRMLEELRVGCSPGAPDFRHST